MRERVTAQGLAGLVGVVFLLVGIAGFVPGIVESYDELGWWKAGSRAELLWVFQTSILHNLVHLAFGLLGLALASRAATARAFLLGGGLVYLALWVYGLAVDKGSGANFVPLDRADDWLHFLLGVLMVALAVMTIRFRPRQPAAR